EPAVHPSAVGAAAGGRWQYRRDPVGEPPRDYRGARGSQEGDRLEQHLRRADRHRRRARVHRRHGRPLLPRIRRYQRRHPVGAAARLRADDGAGQLSRQGRETVYCGRRGGLGIRRAAAAWPGRPAAQQRIGDRLRAAGLRRGFMGRTFTILLGAAAVALAGTADAQETITHPEGARMSVASDLAYKPGELTEAQLTSSTRDLFVQDSMNVFRRFPREKTEEMVRFYTEALALRSLNPIQLTSTQQMILTGVGTGQIKLSAGQQGDRKYDLEGGYRGGTGIRFFLLSYPDHEIVKQRFREAGFPEPEFVERSDGSRQALVRDPGGF